MHLDYHLPKGRRGGEGGGREGRGGMRRRWKGRGERRGGRTKERSGRWRMRNGRPSKISQWGVSHRVTYRQSIFGKVVFSSKNSTSSVQISSFKPLAPHPCPLPEGLPHLQFAVLNAEELSGMQSEIFVSLKRRKPWTEKGPEPRMASSNISRAPRNKQLCMVLQTTGANQCRLFADCFNTHHQHKAEERSTAKKRETQRVADQQPAIGLGGRSAGR